MPVSLALIIALSRSFLACLHSLQRFGGFCNPLSRKNICSPIVQTKLFPQSMQEMSVSVKSGSLAKVFRLNSLRLVGTDLITDYILPSIYCYENDDCWNKVLVKYESGFNDSIKRKFSVSFSWGYCLFVHQKLSLTLLKIRTIACLCQVLTIEEW